MASSRGQTTRRQRVNLLGPDRDHPGEQASADVEGDGGGFAQWRCAPR
jgi:hypothetical protein